MRPCIHVRIAATLPRSQVLPRPSEGWGAGGNLKIVQDLTRASWVWDRVRMRCLIRLVLRVDSWERHALGI